MRNNRIIAKSNKDLHYSAYVQIGYFFRDFTKKTDIKSFRLFRVWHIKFRTKILQKNFMKIKYTVSDVYPQKQKLHFLLKKAFTYIVAYWS